MAKYPNELIKLITFLKKFPGVGAKTAERFTFQLLHWTKEDLKNFSNLISTLKDVIQHCPECGCIKASVSPCDFCNPERQQSNLLCIISSPKDVFSIEQTHTYKGLYHVLNHLLSPIEGKTIDAKDLIHLKNRIERHGVKEVIIALDSTLEGDATSLYLKEQLNLPNLIVSRLALGIPMGSSLEYIDGGTLTRALMGRNSF